MSDGVQADADAILVLEPREQPATAGWPRTYSYADLAPANLERATVSAQQVCLSICSEGV